MLVRTVEATAFGTNCWVLADAPGQECLVVDPGFGVTDRLRDVLREHRLRPAAVLLTHGHADHVWSVTPVSRTAGEATAVRAPVPVHVHADDRYRLRDPLEQLGAQTRPLVESMLAPADRWEEPDVVLDLPGDPGGAVRLQVAGLALEVHHAPGHTEGSVVFHLPGAVDPDGPDGDGLLLSGDLLFAGSVGRSDLAGGDPAQMERSLRDVLPRFGEEVVVLPGHGARTTMARERATNPFLTQLPGGRR
ncbi:MBL fold metallo-hydrolase [Aquipuribacter hungaricus]|uniref:MBL fold metallo-hydrolase n=1 Tax=Aquipuribacter hungaricus TaxID=545624 RepID=A0ABV7WFY8_9MICO